MGLEAVVLLAGDESGFLFAAHQPNARTTNMKVPIHLKNLDSMARLPTAACLSAGFGWECSKYHHSLTGDTCGGNEIFANLN
ncbi:hypothetical protein [Cupriavidus sp. D384]|uniref:hypothetical protein n=1 Tax=Cupriavidus sp. D384 TaxID=1538095 RepID=UPI0012E81B9D|nr:hypothetical protein [Cupriavidus sp. D384]